MIPLGVGIAGVEWSPPFFKMQRKPEFSTDDEKNFITHLADNNQRAFWNYYHIVMHGLRWYDVGVDVGAVREHFWRMARYVRNQMEIAEHGAPTHPAVM